MISQRLVQDILKRLAGLEDTTVRVRTGVVTDDSPLSVALGGGDVPFTGLKSLEGQTYTPGDTVACLVWKGDLLVLGVIA